MRVHCPRCEREVEAVVRSTKLRNAAIGIGVGLIGGLLVFGTGGLGLAALGTATAVAGGAATATTVGGGLVGAATGNNSVACPHCENRLG